MTYLNFHVEVSEGVISMKMGVEQIKDRLGQRTPKLFEHLLDEIWMNRRIDEQQALVRLDYTHIRQAMRFNKRKAMLG